MLLILGDIVAALRRKIHSCDRPNSRSHLSSLPAICDQLRNPDQLRQSQIAPPAPHGVKQPETLIVAGWHFRGTSAQSCWTNPRYLWAGYSLLTLPSSLMTRARSAS